MRKLLPILIFIIAVLAIYINLGAKIPFRLAFGSIKINRTFEKPDLDILGGRFGKNWNFKEGLDLAGGTHLVLSADMSKVSKANRDASLESLKGIIERRVNLLGVSEPLVQTSKSGNDYRLIVEIAGVTDVNEAINLVGRTAQLSFREEIDASDAAKIATAEATLYGPFQKPTNLTGNDLQRADPAFDTSNGSPIIQMNFTPEGAKKFEEITQRNLGKRLAIFLDDQVLMAPTIQSVISGGKAIISGSFTVEDTKQDAILLNSGALPAPVKVIEQRVVGATLGAESIQKSLIAGILGMLIIVFFMVGNYKYLGFLASIALIVYVLVTLAIFKLIPVTLTLAGIAGFILSIGMAVDANILIFERIKEEIRWGRGRLSAIEIGFVRAFPSIRDSNVSSLITCAILYEFGSGAVRGFALTLAIGIAMSLFSAISVTRTLLRLFYEPVLASKKQ